MAQFEFLILEFNPQKDLQGSSVNPNIRPYEPWLSLGLEKKGMTRGHPLSPSPIRG